MNFKMYKLTEYPELEKIYQDVITKIDFSHSQPKTQSKTKVCLKQLIMNLYQSYYSGYPITVPTDHNAFLEGGFYHKFHIDRIPFKQAFKALGEHMHVDKGFKAFNGLELYTEGRCTTIYPNSLMEKSFGNLDVLLESDIGPLLEFREKIKKKNVPMEVEETPEIDQLRQEINYLNEVLKKSIFTFQSGIAGDCFFNPFHLYTKSSIEKIAESGFSVELLRSFFLHHSKPFFFSGIIPFITQCSDIKTIYSKDILSTFYHNRHINILTLCSPNQTSREKSTRFIPALKAVFNGYRLMGDDDGKFAITGGRLYYNGIGANWQSMSQLQRRSISINGHETCELDYKGFHLRILYAQDDIALNSNYDPYLIEGLDKSMRPVLKQLLLAFINAKNDTETASSMKDTVWKLKRRPILTERELAFLIAAERNGFGRNENEPWLDLIERFKATHQPISRYFCSSAGIWLQRLDSEIMREVLLRGAAKNIAALPIHDSIIIETGNEKTMTKIMHNAFSDVLSRNIICPVEKK